MKKFHTGTILSISHGPLVAPDKMDDIYAILNFMTGDNLFTHVLPRAAEECKPHLFRQHRWLSEVPDPDIKDGWDWEAWLDDAIRKHGEWHEVTPIPADDHMVKEPISELVDMVGKDKVIVAKIEPQE